MAIDTHRGWSISHDHPPVPVRDMDWSATSPDYDASYEGPEDGWVASGTRLTAATREDLVALIDDEIDGGDERP